MFFTCCWCAKWLFMVCTVLWKSGGPLIIRQGILLRSSVSSTRVFEAGREKKQEGRRNWWCKNAAGFVPWLFRDRVSSRQSDQFRKWTKREQRAPHIHPSTHPHTLSEQPLRGLERQLRQAHLRDPKTNLLFFNDVTHRPEGNLVSHQPNLNILNKVAWNCQKLCQSPNKNERNSNNNKNNNINSSRTSRWRRGTRRKWIELNNPVMLCKDASCSFTWLEVVPCRSGN